MPTPQNKTIPIGYLKKSANLNKNWDGIIATTLNNTPQIAFIYDNDVVFHDAADILFPKTKAPKNNAKPTKQNKTSR